MGWGDKKVGDYEDLLETLMLARQHPALLSIYFSFTILLQQVQQKLQQK